MKTEEDSGLGRKHAMYKQARLILLSSYNVIGRGLSWRPKASGTSV